MYGEATEPNLEAEEAYKLLVKWAWSRKAENIRFTGEALNHAREAFKAIYEKYASANLPIVHNASYWTLLRLATAIATLEFNTLDGENLTVEKKHVDEAAGFYEQTLIDLELDEYKIFFREEELSEEEYEKIKAELDEKEGLKAFLLEVAKAPGDSHDLAGRLSVSSVTIKRRASDLKELGVLKRGRSGYYLTKKGISFLKRMRDDTIDTPDSKNKNLDNKGVHGNRVSKVSHLKFLPQTVCERCRKKGAYVLVRADGVHYLCEKCLEDWEGPL